MSIPNARGLKNSIIACAILAVAFAASYLLERYARGIPLLILISATILCSLYSGLWLGVGAAIASAIGLNFLFQDPRFALGFYYVEDVIELVAFTLLAVLVSTVGARLRKAKMEADEAIRARESLLAVVSHDMNNPLLAMQLATQLIEKSGSDQHAQAYIQAVRVLKSSTDRLSRLIHDILDYEKIRLGTFEVSLQPEPLQQMMDEVQQMMRPLAEPKSQRIQVDSDESGSILCDRQRVLQVFSNLVGNSIKFMGTGGTIVIGCRSTATGFRFFVRDDGPGIPEQQLGHVFDRYWQAPKTARQGTGLGLSIARGIVEAHHGTIWVESKIGQGSTFSFTLPRTNERRSDE